MTLQEIERRDDHGAKRTKRRKRRVLSKAERARREAERAQIAQYQNPNLVLTFGQWCLLNSFSKATGKRIIGSGAGPIVTELSPNRIGVTLANNARWQESRARG
jgi:hypothetical protein